MASPKEVLKAIGPKLVPFFKSVLIYFVLFIPTSKPSILAAVLKCLPVLSLMGFVLVHGMSFGKEYTYSRRILLGLIFSAVGDALLIWNELFFHGLLSFLLAQIFYISAFGFTPVNHFVGGITYGITAVGLIIILPGVQGIMFLGILFYAVILMTMVWRAVARVQLFGQLWTWTKLCACAGGILFAFSDSCIGFNEFYFEIPHSQAVIMVTYYAAQLFISLSVVDSKSHAADSPSKTSSCRSSFPDWLFSKTLSDKKLASKLI